MHIVLANWGLVVGVLITLKVLLVLGLALVIFF